jgi:hypothetical protein
VHSVNAVSPGHPPSSNPSRYPAYLISKKMTETPEKVVEEQVNPEEAEVRLRPCLRPPHTSELTLRQTPIPLIGPTRRGGRTWSRQRGPFHRVFFV